MCQCLLSLSSPLRDSSGFSKGEINEERGRERELFNLRPPPGSRRSSRSVTDARQRFGYRCPNKQHGFSRKPRELNRRED